MKRSGHLVSLIVVSIRQGFQGLVFRNLTSTGIKNEEVTHEHAMARDHLNKFIIAKVDTSKNQQIAIFFNIRGVPTFMFFKDGALIGQISGAVSRDILEQKLGTL